jgi:stalled ribosome rescue protein Dom34
MTDVDVTAQGRRTAVWMDGNEAKVFHVLPGGFDESTVAAPNHHVHRHPKDQWARIHNHPDDEHRFFRALAKVLDGADHILIAGPSVAKLRFLRFLNDDDLAVASKVEGLETADHPSDAQFAAHVRAYFSRHDR